MDLSIPTCTTTKSNQHMSCNKVQICVHKTPLSSTTPMSHIRCNNSLYFSSCSNSYTNRGSTLEVPSTTIPLCPGCRRYQLPLHRSDPRRLQVRTKLSNCFSIRIYGCSRRLSVYYTTWMPIATNAPLISCRHSRDPHHHLEVGLTSSRPRWPIQIQIQI